MSQPRPSTRPGPRRGAWAGQIGQILKGESSLAGSLVTAALFGAFGGRWLTDLSNPAWLAFMLIWLFCVILGSAFAIVRHAEELAHRVGEPLGTLILTLAVTGIEVMMITAMMYAGPANASLARDAMFAVIMIVLNGMVGLTLLLGGLTLTESRSGVLGLLLMTLWWFMQRHRIGFSLSARAVVLWFCFYACCMWLWPTCFNRAIY